MSFSVTYAGLAGSTSIPVDLRTSSPNAVGPNFFITTLLDGSFVMGWNSNDGNGSGVFLQRLMIGLNEDFDFDLVPVGSATRANTTIANDQHRPRIVPLFDGGFGVAWESFGQDGSFGGIYGQLYDILGNKSGIETRLNVTTAGNQMQPAALPFSDFDSPGFGILWTSGGANRALSANFQGGSIVGRGFDLQPDGSYRSDPDQVLWNLSARTEFNEVPITFGAAIPNADQVVIGVEVRYFEAGGSGQEITDSREALVGFVSFNEDDTTNVVEIALQQDLTTSTDSGEVRIADMHDGSNVYVTWQEETATQMTIFGRLFLADGTPAGSVQTLVTQALNGETNHRHYVKLLDTGYLLLVWDDTTGTGIKGQWLNGLDGTAGTPFSNQVVLMFSNTELDAPRLTPDDIGGAVLAAIEADGGNLAGGSGQIEAELVTVEDMILNLNPIVVSGFFEDTTGRAGRVEGGTGTDTINAGGGDDILVGGLGNDILNGGTGDDIYWFQDAGDILSESGGDGFDTVWAFFNSILLPNGIEEIIFKGDDPESPVDFVATGNELDNTIVSGSGDDTIDGGGGDNLIDFGERTGDSDTYLFSGAEDDVAFLNIHLGTRSPFTLNGVSTGDIVAMTTRNGRFDRMVGVEQVKIGAGNAQAVGSANIARNVNGDRYLTDENPNDDTTTIFKGGAKKDVLDLLDGDDTAAAGAGDDVLLGRDGNDTLRGELGNDTLDGGVGSDVLEGGVGNDTYIMDIEVDAVTDTGGIDTLSTRLGSFNLTDIGGPATIERLEHLGDNNFTGTGNALANTITGGGGEDILDGGLGADRLVGLGGDDVYVVGAGDLVVEAAGGGDNDRIRSSLASQVLGKFVEHLERADPNATTAFIGTGNELNNDISGGAGADVLNGLVGNDTLSALGGKDILNGGLGDDSLAGGDGDDKLFGNDGGDRLDGGAGNDVLDGGLGDDTLVASDGNDTFSGGLGSDTLDLSGLGWSFAGKGTAGGFTVKKVDPNTFTLTRETQVLTIKGAFNSATADRGIETYKFTDNAAVTLPLLLANAMSNFDHDTFVGSEGVDATIDGAGGNDQLSGNGGDDVLLGGLGLDTLLGGSGNDVLDGGAGNDSLNGGTGVDTMSGGAGIDIYEVDEAGDVVSETLTLAQLGGIDEVITTLTSRTLEANVDKLTYNGIAASAFTGTGNALVNVIKGRDGDDTLDGAGGADTLIGGEGNDTYLVDVTADKITETGSGIDSVISRANVYTLALNVENLSFDGSGKFTGTGNLSANSISGGDGDDLLGGLGGDDVLSGGAGNDTLNGGDNNDSLTGGDGNDVLNGGGGNDTLTGGAGVDKFTGGLGDDIFIFDMAPVSLDAGVLPASFLSQFDAVLDLGLTDRLHLDNSIFTALGAEGVLDASLFSLANPLQRVRAGDQLDTPLVYEKATGLLFYDADGAGEGGAQIIGRIVAGAGNTIDATDFVVI